MMPSIGCLPKFKGDSIGPYLYWQVGANSYVHAGVRSYRDVPWQHGLGAWLTVRLRGRSLVFWRRGA